MFYFNKKVVEMFGLDELVGQNGQVVFFLAIPEYYRVLQYIIVYEFRIIYSL